VAQDEGSRRKGRAIVAGDTVTLVFERTLQHSASRVWEAIATAAGLREWLMVTDIAIDGRVGGTIEMVSGPAQYRSQGRILSWDPPRLFEYEWNVAPVPEMPRGEHAIFRYELTPAADATLLTVTYRRITKPTASGMLPGLHALLDRLEAQLSAAPLPNWQARFTELLGQYPPPMEK
jgi:uncharacterized protein YndB with AHSA1/START domain